MSTIVTRSGKGSPLSHAEVDANFTNLNTDKVEVAGFAAAVAATPSVTANTAKTSNATHTGDVTGSVALTIANDAVTNAKAANMATATIKGRTTAGTGDPEDLTPAQATALLDVATAALKGLGPARSGVATQYLSGTGVYSTPAGGGSGDVVGPASATDNAIARFDAATGKLVQNSSVLILDTGEMTLPLVATPGTPPADTVNVFGRKVGGRMLLGIEGPTGLDTALQPHLGRNKAGIWIAGGNGVGDTQLGITMTGTGTATAANVATTNLHSYMRRREFLVTVASVTAVAGMRTTALQYGVGGTAAGFGGFHMIYRWGPATGVSVTTNRSFAGMRNSGAAPTDVEPSTILNMCGMGWDAADTNIQFMRNDGAGTATKIDLGASFPVPTVDRQEVYDFAMFSPPGTTQSVEYELTNLRTGAVATGTVTTDLPTTATLLAFQHYMSVGGTSSVIGVAPMSLYIETDY